ncbi:hypothetical protein CRYPA_109 [uncultured Candidatus Thioglobus sp.]|nr:hypothetical protein CRYPA_109 [uncultured Candidatus Thioglobus sp.]
MKKQLLIAAVAATMTSAAMADISITGDAHMRFATVESATPGAADINSLDQRIRLKVLGTAGDVKVVLGLRTDNDNDNTARSSGGANPAASGFETDYRYVSAKIGGVTIKAGEWWETTGFGLVRKGQGAGDNVINASTSVGDIDLAIQTETASSSVTMNADTTIADIKVGIEHDTANNTGYTDVTAKGKVSSVNFAIENYSSDATAGDADADLIHLSTKVGGVTYHLARATWDADSGNARANNKKFTPLGVSILATANGVNGNLALGNVNAGTTKDKVTGIRADFNVAGMGVQVAAGNLTVGVTDESFSDIIVTRSLGNGASLKLSAGKWNDRTSMGAKIAVKF